MPANKEILNRRYTRIRSRFDKMKMMRNEDGKRKYPYAVVLKILANQFCYSEKTIENICTTKRNDI